MHASYSARLPDALRTPATCLCSAIALVLAFTAPLAGRALAQDSQGAQTEKVGENSGLPIPRFVSLKSKPTRVRFGPSREHDVAWVFERSSIPVEITQEFDNWRKIKDAEGDSGWMHSSLLSGRRTALVTPWETDQLKTVNVYASASLSGTARYLLQPNVLAAIEECNGTACRLEGEDWKGWIDQTKLWGVYPNERVR